MYSPAEPSNTLIYTSISSHPILGNQSRRARSKRHFTGLGEVVRMQVRVYVSAWRCDQLSSSFVVPGLSVWPMTEFNGDRRLIMRLQVRGVSAVKNKEWNRWSTVE